MLFLELDKINYTNLKESLLNNKKDIVCSVVVFLDENILTVQSSKFVDDIPLFMLRNYTNLHFETFHYGVTAVWMHHLDANKTAREEARRQLHKNVESNIE